jgi:predicted nucleotidyltransferase
MLNNASSLLQAKRTQILAITRHYGATRVRVFGSAARGTADEQSDIDLLVDLAPGRSLFDLGGMVYDLRQLLGKEVDVVTEKGLRSRIRDNVLAEAVDL